MARSTRSAAAGLSPDETRSIHSLTSREKTGAVESDQVSTPWLTTFEWQLLTASTVVKLLLFPCYHSTDFEVHRNWLAITHSLPIREWYFEATSQWTLDYPPFFAYFSWLLAQPSVLVDPLITSLYDGLEYAAWSCKAYMRSTVIVTELVLAAALVAHTRIGSHGNAGDADQSRISTKQVLAASLLMHPGLIIIDHIHFQYNGFLFGVLAWSLWAAREGKFLLCAFLFASLLNLKHIYVYIAPSFLVFLLRSYVFPVGSSLSDLSRPFERLLTVGVITLVPFFLSLAPLAVDGFRHEAGPVGVIAQMVSRLFPFSRGLIHAYWAPNVWALWTFSDRVLVKALQKAPILQSYLPRSFSARYDTLAESGFASASRGLVEHVSFGILPEIKPSMCFLLTLACCTVYMIKLWQTPTYRIFLESVSLCGFASFLFGWHVHEKAIMLVLVPYTLLAGEDYGHMRTFVLLSTAGIVSLFPLLYEPAEGPIKMIYSLVWAIVVFGTLRQRVYRPVQSNIGMMVHVLESLYLWGFLALQVYVSVIHGLLFPSVPSSTILMASPQHSSTTGPTEIISLASAQESGTWYSDSPDASSPAWSSTTSTEALTNEGVLPPSESAHQPDLSAILDTSTSISYEGVMPSPIVADLIAPEPKEAATPLIPLESVTDVETFLESTAAATPETPSEPSTPTIPSLSSEKTSHESNSSSDALPTPILASIPATTSLEFLPLMLVSVYCTLGVVWTWIRASNLYFRQPSH